MFKIVLRRIATLLYLALRVAGGWLRRRALRIIALTYLAILVVLPVLWIFHEAFASGLQAVWDAATAPGALHALYLSVLIALIAVVVNTVFGVVTALTIVRHPFPGVSIVNLLVDLPLGLSPVVVGLCLVLVYGDTRAGLASGLPLTESPLSSLSRG